jgi:glycerol-3-phosphate dehydrogenase (NAD(P)+)
LKENPDKLPYIKMPDSTRCYMDIDETIKDADIILIALPSQIIRKTLSEISRFNTNIPVVCCSKGIEENTGNTMAEVIEKSLPDSKVVVLSGPSHAEEIGRRIPTAVVAASKHRDMALKVQDVFMSDKFRVYTSKDVKGVELGGAVKNIIALCAGISDGLGFGDNTKAALMTRGMAEIIRFGVKLGADRETFSGLSGIGDLIVTCTSGFSRNRQAGILIGKGMSAEKAQQKVGMIVESITTLKPVFELSQKHDVEMPITEKAYEIIYKHKNPGKAVEELMTRDKKDE